MTDMMMIVMEVVMGTEMMTGMVMGEKENGATGMMNIIVDMGSHMVMMEIAMVEILVNATAEMVTGRMITGEEVKAATITGMDQLGVLTKKGTELMKMMVKIHLGMWKYYKLVSGLLVNSCILFIRSCNILWLNYLF